MGTSIKEILPPKIFLLLESRDILVRFISYKCIIISSIQSLFLNVRVTEED